MKTIKDAVHGHIHLTELQDQLIHTPEVQRLAWIKQLGLTKLVFPGANNSRLEHDLGVSYVAGQIANRLDFNFHNKNLVEAAGMLHDLGHTPFSHTLEPLLPKDHMQFTSDLITGKEKMPFDGTGQIPDILEKFDLNPKDVADLINRKYTEKKYLQQVVFGEIDADQLDFLQRDAHYSGTSFGVIDSDRIINVMQINNDEIVFKEKGISALESFLTARDHMYTDVYIHHAASIAEKMLERAMKSAVGKMPDFYYYTDGELLTKLKQSNKYAEDMVNRIQHRRLFKRAFEISSRGIKKDLVDEIQKLVKLGEDKIETQLCEKTGVEKGYLLVDLSAEMLKLTEPRLKQVKVKVIKKDGSTVSLTTLSSLARALSEKEAVSSLFTVFCKPEDREKVRTVTEQYINEL